MNKALIRQAALGCAVLLSPASAVAATDLSEPNVDLTPGAIDPSATLVVICAHTRSRRHVTPATRYRILADYNVTPDHQYEYEMDHLIPLALGGANSAANLWPQPWPEAEIKDVLESRMQEMVCHGAVPLERAQQEIAEDWIGAYRKYVGKLP